MTALRAAMVAAEEILPAVAKTIPRLGKNGVLTIPAIEDALVVSTKQWVKGVVKNGGTSPGLLARGMNGIKGNVGTIAVTGGALAVDYYWQAKNNERFEELQENVQAEREKRMDEADTAWRANDTRFTRIENEMQSLRWYLESQVAANATDPTAKALRTLLANVENGGNIPENGRNTPDYNTLLQKFNSTFPGFKLTFGKDGMPIMDPNAIKKYASESDGMVTPRDVWLSIKGLIDSYPAHIPTPTANRRATTTV